MVKAKALEIRYTLLNCYLVDILSLSEAFGGARIGNCDIKPTDGDTMFAYLATGKTSGVY